MKAMITDKTDVILTQQDLPNGDFAFLGNGAIVLTIETPGIPYRLMLLEDDGRVIAEGRFFKEIALNQVWHNAGDEITIKLSLG